ncbi:MAG TPA: acetate--CoA ligase family protein, partial [Methanomicrobiales archaeon]|nr:acetate--CoA ligase family protein [Methanomicrobiales archaeon]
MAARRLLSEAEGYGLLKKKGIPVPEYRIVQSEDAAADFSDEIGYPVAMKIVSPEIVHKTDAGGVILNVKSAAEVREAYRSIVARVKEHAPQAEIQGVMVEKQMPPGLELIIGGRRDPTFGKVITFGIGGVLVELLRDVSIRVLPIDRGEGERMIRDIRGYRLISGYRGNRLDEEALLESILKVSAWFYGDPSIDEFDINPLILYEDGASAVDARVYVREKGETVKKRAERREFSPDTFYADSIAVVGASSDPRKIGYAVFRNLLSYPGRLYPVNPKRGEILGHKAYESIASIPGSVEMAVIAVPAPAVPQVMEECGKKGVKLAVIVSAGFRETGEKGRETEERLLSIAKQYGMRIVGPNSLGIMLPHQGINTTFDPIAARPGHIGFVSQSGAIITTVVDWSIPEEIGFSAVVSVGNQLDLSFTDYLQFLKNDPNTRAIILYIEEIRNGKEFMDIVEEVSKEKPIIAIKSGFSEKGKAAAASHTGSLAGSYEVYMAAFKQSG